MFSIYINHLEIGANSMLIKFVDDTKLKDSANMNDKRWINNFERVYMSKNDLVLKKSGEYNGYK